jgi:hypothetical protein
VKPETKFRVYKVLPFLKSLKNTSYFAIQQISIRGDADYILCALGRFVWLELKDAGEEPRALQLYKADWVRRTGGVVLIASPDNWRRVQSQLRKLDEGDDDD